MRRGEDQPDRSGGQRRFELLGIRLIIDRHHHPAAPGRRAPRRSRPESWAPKSRPGCPDRPDVLQPWAKRSALSATVRCPARNTVFSEGDHARVLVARPEIAQQTGDIPTIDQSAPWSDGSDGMHGMTSRCCSAGGEGRHRLIQPARQIPSDQS